MSFSGKGMGLEGLVRNNSVSTSVNNYPAFYHGHKATNQTNKQNYAVLWLLNANDSAL